MIRHFPEQRGELEALFQRDHTFRSMCADYRDCLQAIERWCGSPPRNERAPALCEEYRTLMAELKSEISALVERSEEDGKS